MKISSAQNKLILFFLLMAVFFTGKTEAGNDTECRDSLESRQAVQSQASPLAFTYKNVRDYIFSHLSYPAQAVEEEIEGTVLIRFTLMTDGSIDSVEILTSQHPLLDSEAVRLIRNMPKWKPVYLQGQPVPLSYKVPVIFELLPPETGQDSLKQMRKEKSF